MTTESLAETLLGDASLRGLSSYQIEFLARMQALWVLHEDGMRKYQMRDGSALCANDSGYVGVGK